MIIAHGGDRGVRRDRTGLLTQRRQAQSTLLLIPCRRSIKLTPAKRVSKFLITSQVGSFDVNYASYEEILHPFLRPAYDRYAPALDQRMAKRLKGKIK